MTDWSSQIAKVKAVQQTVSEAGNLPIVGDGGSGMVILDSITTLSNVLLELIAMVEMLHDHTFTS